MSRPLFRNKLNAFEVFNGTLLAGEYDFYFAVDSNADGEPNATWYDSVRVTVDE